MVVAVNTRPMIKDAANPTKDGTRGLKHFLKDLVAETRRPKDEINHNAAVFAPDKGEEHIPFNAQPNKDETIEEKRERKEQNPNENTANLQEAHLNAALYRQAQMNKNLKDLNKAGFKIKENQEEQLLKRAVFSPTSNNPDDPMALKKRTQTITKRLVDTIEKKNLSAEEIDKMLRSFSRVLKLPNFGQIKNTRPDLYRRYLLRELRKNNRIRNNVQRQIDIEKKKPKLFTDIAAAGVKNALSDR